MKNKIDSDIIFLKERGFEVSYSDKDRILTIEKDSMFIHCMKNLLIGAKAKESDTESYNIFEEFFLNNYSFYLRDDNIFGLSVKSRFISFDLTKLGFKDSTIEEKNKIRRKIGFLVSMHINNNLIYLEKKERMGNLILSI